MPRVPRARVLLVPETMPPRTSPVIRRYRFGRVLTSDLGFEAHRPPGEPDPARFRPVSKGLAPAAVEDGLLPEPNPGGSP